MEIRSRARAITEYVHLSSGNGAWISLDVCNNNIPNDQETNLRRIYDSKNIDLKL